MKTKNKKSTPKKRNEVILSIYPNSIGFGYAIVDNVKQPIDYGIVNLRMAKTKRYVNKAKQIIEDFHPTILILEDYQCGSFRKTKRMKRIIQALKEEASKKQIRVRYFSKNNIREAFSAFEAHSKYEIAKVITSWLPELEKIPVYKREAWQSEPYSMTVFDAFALALTHFYLE